METEDAKGPGYKRYECKKIRVQKAAQLISWHRHSAGPLVGSTAQAGLPNSSFQGSCVPQLSLAVTCCSHLSPLSVRLKCGCLRMRE